MLRIVRTIVTSCVLTLSFASAFAQLSTATMFGTVVDTDGAAVPNATVTLVQTQTNFARTFTTKADGTYREEFLPVGPYRVSVQATGFQTLERTGVELSVMEMAQLNLTVSAGGGSFSVTVTADAPLVNIGNSTLGNTIDNRQIDSLPLINRQVTQLLTLVPGVQSVQTLNSLGFQELHVLVNGSPDSIVGQTSYYLDGGLNMTGLRNTGNQVPNPDAISQFNVVTNNYSAQLGRYSSAVVSVLTKSGTNDFHGSAFEFYRSRNFNAVTHNQTIKNPYNQHRFGVTVGGKIRKDKDFFFGSFAGFRFIQYGNYSGSLPSDAQMAGNFSENLPVASEQASCNAPPTAAANAAVHFLVCHPTTYSPVTGAGTALTPYAGNILPAVDATAVNILKYVKAKLPAQQPAQFGDTRYIYRTLSPLPEQNEEYLIKTDHQITSKHRLTLSYFLLNYKVRIAPTTLTQAWSYSNYANKQQNASISDTWAMSDRTINQLYVTYGRQYGGRIANPQTSLATFGTDLGIVGSPSLSNIAVGGVEAFTLGQSITGPKAGANVYGLRNVLSTTRGSHSLYLGGEAGLEKDFQLTLLNNYGTFAFNTGNGTGAARTTNGLSDFLAGIPTTMNQDTPLYASADYFSYGLFAQDDWRIRPNLTVNIGIRYDFQQAPTNSQRMQTNFQPGVQSHAFSNVKIVGIPTAKLAPIGMLFPGDPGVPKGGVFSPINHVSPRVGFAYDPYGTGKTVFHGAGGLFFGGISGNMWEYPSNYSPYAVRSSFNKVVSLTHPYQNDPTEFPGGLNPFPSLAFNYSNKTASFLALNQVVAFDPNYRWPYTIQANFGVQQQFGRNTAVSINFVGNYNRKSPIYNDINAPTYNVNPNTNASGPSCFVAGSTTVPDTTRPCGYGNSSSTVNNRRPLNSTAYGGSASTPIYSNVWIIRGNQNSNYNGLQVSVEQRLTHHVSARGFYTWSRTLQSNALDSTGSTAGVFVDANYPQLEYRQRSDQDRRHMLTASLVWKPDYFDHFNRVVQSVLNGWTVTAIATANSGAPFTVTTGSDNYFSGLGNNRPSVSPGKIARVLNNNGSRVAAMKQWFDTSAYCIAGTGSCPGVGPLNLLGNTRPATLDAPGYRNVDASLLRTFKLYNQFRFEMRGEFSNVFNLTNLGAPTAVMNSPTFGQVTGSSTTGNNRIIQVGGRLLF
ncbi:MAG: TonB-dependent receptor [Granulicella sp.]